MDERAEALTLLKFDQSFTSITNVFPVIFTLCEPFLSITKGMIQFVKQNVLMKNYVKHFSFKDESTTKSASRSFIAA